MTIKDINQQVRVNKEKKMSVVMEVYSLIKDLMSEAEKARNYELYSSLIDIKKQINEIDEENQRLKKLLDIRESIKYDEGAQSFTLTDDPEIHYCSVCYGQYGKLIPMSYNKDRKFLCRICEERWISCMSRK